MKLKKILLTMLSAILLMSITVVGTLAYLQATTETVQNTFTVGKVSFGDTTLGGGLTEADVNEYGEPLKDEKTTKADGSKVTREEADRVTSNEYKLMPGHTYVKDPTVVIAADSEASYVRMIVTISDIADVKSVIGAAVPESVVDGKFLPQYLVEGWDGKVWVSTEEIAESGDTATYEFRYYTTVSTVDTTAAKLPALFTHIIVPEGIDNDDLLKLDEMQIDVVAHAIQADGFQDAADAWSNWN